MNLKQDRTSAEKKVTEKLDDLPHPTLDATLYLLVFGVTAIGGLVSYGAYQLFKPERKLAHKAKAIVAEHQDEHAHESSKKAGR